MKSNGVVANGQKSNGQKSNGQKSNGQKSNGQTINSVQVGTNALSTPTLLGYDDLSNPITGPGFVGAKIWAQYSDGTTEQVTVSAYDPNTIAPYELYLVVDGSGESICGTYTDGSVLWASPMAQTFDLDTGVELYEPGLFTFACMKGAILKAEIYGYPPGMQFPETYNGVTKYRSSDIMHDAATRMIRADYCGDGLTHTLNGTNIDIRDVTGVETDTTTGTNDPVWGPWYTEAEWRPDGAVCINKTRWMPSPAASYSDNHDPNQNPHWAYVLANCPWRIAGYNDGVHPVVPCGAQSTYLPQNGFNIADQTQRSLIANNTPLYAY